MSMYQVGWAKSEIVGLSTNGHAMFGWGMWFNRATGQKTPLFARAISITDTDNKTAVICCLDLGYVSYPMRQSAIGKIKEKIPDFDADGFMMTATHTHSGPAGCSTGSMYNLITPGYLPKHVDAIATATADAVITALAGRKETDIALLQDTFADDVEVAWNRSIKAYNANKDTTNKSLAETHLALDRDMNLLSFERDGTLMSLLSIFGVHATCVGNTHQEYNGDNKGYASAQAEALLKNDGIDSPVAIFAQGVAGDISPYFQGKGDIAKRAKLDKEDQIAYAKSNGALQREKVMQMLQKTEDVNVHLPLSGGISSALIYVDFTNIKAKADYANGVEDAYTADPCLGVSMFEGTRVDGPGMPKAIGMGARVISRRVKKKRLSENSKLSIADKNYYAKLYKAHGNKDILMEAERKLSLGVPIAKIAIPGMVDPTLNELKKQARTGAMQSHPMVPTVVPLQMIRIGQIVILCCPGEFTTISGKRITDMIKEKLADEGVSQVIMVTYCNEFMGYVTTQEEYQTQLYEGGHTAYGQWTQAAFQTKFEELTEALITPEDKRDDAYKQANALRPTPIPADDLATLTNLTPPKKW